MSSQIKDADSEAEAKPAEFEQVLELEKAVHFQGPAGEAKEILGKSVWKPTVSFEISPGKDWVRYSSVITVHGPTGVLTHCGSRPSALVGLICW